MGTPSSAQSIHPEEIELDLHAEIRLDRAVLEHLQREHPLLSRARLKEYFRKDQILLQGRPAPASPVLHPGRHRIQILDWKSEAATSPRASAASEGCFLPIIHEDEELLVLNKSSGVPSVPHSPQETHTAVGAALAYHPELCRIGRGGLEPGIVHRLDTGTSGLLVFAKTQESFDRLREAWKNGQVKKIYRAISRKKDEGTLVDFTRAPLPHRIPFPLGHDLSSDKRMIALLPDRERSIRGKPMPAETHVLAARAVAGTPQVLDLEIQIITGVMHQIRCHLSTVGWPIQGDSVYRGTPSSRLWLHAWKLSLPGAGGARIELESPLPRNWPGLGGA